MPILSPINVPSPFSTDSLSYGRDMVEIILFFYGLRMLIVT